MDWQKWITDKAEEVGYEVVAHAIECSPRLIYFMARGERSVTWGSKIDLAQAYPELRIFLALEIGKGWGGGGE